MTRPGRGDAERRVADVGEFALIEAISDRLQSTSDTVIGPGDDAAVLSLGAGPGVVVSVDTLVDGIDFRRDWSTAADIGHHAMAAGVADIEAMGVRPVGAVVALVLPESTAVDWVLELTDGLAAEATAAGCAVVGGDLSAGDQISIGVTAIGDPGSGPIVTRAGARAGDVVAVAGRLGWAAAGLTVLSRGFRSPRVLADAHRRPQPPYGSGRRAAAAGATAMIDVSDGLVADLAHLARASRVLIAVESGLVPVSTELSAAAAAFNLDPLTWALGGGDDHALAATFPPDVELPAEFVRIGRVLETGSDGGAGNGGVVTIDGDAAVISGHEHFRR